MRNFTLKSLAIPGVLLALGAAAVVSPGMVQAQVEYTRMSGAGRDIRHAEIAPGVFQFTTMRDSYVRQLNSVVVVNDKDVLVFDTGTRPSSTALILKEIRKITLKPVRFVVNSHGHPDHWSSNEVYAKAFPGVDFIATDGVAKHMRANAGIWVPRFTTQLAQMKQALADEISTGKRGDDSPLTAEARRQDEEDVKDYASFLDEQKALTRVFPTLTYTGTMTFSHGGREFQFISVTGDQEGTTVLYLPKEKLLLTGDAVSFPIPYVSPKPSQQVADLKRLDSLDVGTIVPGHGPAFRDHDFLRLEIALLDGVLNGVAEARKRGVTSVEDLQKAVTLDDLRGRFAHKDPDLEARFNARVQALVAYTVAETTAP